MKELAEALYIVVAMDGQDMVAEHAIVSHCMGGSKGLTGV